MSKFKIWLPILICLLLSCSCERKNKYNPLISKDYEGYVDYADTEWQKRSECQNQHCFMEDKTFYFDMKAPIDLTTIDYDFYIIGDRFEYKGPFERRIKVDDFLLTIHNYIVSPTGVYFVLIDHTNRQLYMWGNKSVYPLYKKDKYHVKLRSNGEFDIDIPEIGG